MTTGKTFATTMPTGVASAILLAAAALAALPDAAHGQGRLALDLSQQEATRGELTVDARTGTARLVKNEVALALALKGEVADDAGGYRIIASELYLKQAGSAAGTVRLIGALPGNGSEMPGRQVAAAAQYTFSFDPLGPVAQNAMALCASASPRALPDGAEARYAMTVPVVWRATSGRFNFRSFAFDGVKPDEAALANPDFYADQEVQEAEAAAIVDVRCEGDVRAPAAAALSPAVTKTVAAEVPKPTPSKSQVQRTSAGPTDPVTRTAPARPVENAGSKPVCDGGMVRETSAASGSQGADYVCLCPGNTRRLENGPNVFACERRLARSR